MLLLLLLSRFSRVRLCVTPCTIMQKQLLWWPQQLGPRSQFYETQSGGHRSGLLVSVNMLINAHVIMVSPLRHFSFLFFDLSFILFTSIAVHSCSSPHWTKSGNIEMSVERKGVITLGSEHYSRINSVANLQLKLFSTATYVQR